MTNEISNNIDDNARRIIDAVDYLEAKPAPDGDGYVYYADEVHSWYRVNEERLADLAESLASDDPDAVGDAYSLWCSRGTGEEISDEDARRLGLSD